MAVGRYGLGPLTGGSAPLVQLPLRAAAGAVDAARPRPRPLAEQGPRPWRAALLGSSLGVLGARARGRWRFRRALRAVVEGGPHAAAVQNWLQSYVVDLNLCPWAGPAAEEGHVRVVASTATDEAGVLADLRSEAERLRPSIAGGATTTLLACPDVAAWEDFGAFEAFYQDRLAGGYAFASLGLYVVSFHPRYGDCGRVETGDVIQLADGPGGPVRARVLDAQAGFGAQGERLGRVSLLDGGEETLICLPPEPGPSEMASRAPRPVLHFLRTADLERAEADPGMRDRNLRTAEELGPDGAERLLRKCG